MLRLTFKSKRKRKKHKKRNGKARKEGDEPWPVSLHK
ncbi:hypothetical protein 2210_scaffold709_00039 [Bacteriophage sp.]|nr:hypothetical protein 2210_scaffold709_00039 [Bacteriophage sp.]